VNAPFPPMSKPVYRAVSPARIGAMVLRHFYLLRSSWPRLFVLMYWPLVQMLMWGFLQTWLLQQRGGVAMAGDGGENVVFGPQTYERTMGTIDVYEDVVQVDTAGPYLLLVHNGDPEGGEVAAATVSINDVDVIGPEDLDPTLPSVRRLATSLIKFFEDRGQAVRGNAWSRVFHRNGEFAIGRFRCDPDQAALRSKLDGITEEISQHLKNALGIHS